MADQPKDLAAVLKALKAIGAGNTSIVEGTAILERIIPFTPDLNVRLELVNLMTTLPSLMPEALNAWWHGEKYVLGNYSGGEVNQINITVDLACNAVVQAITGTKNSSLAFSTNLVAGVSSVLIQLDEANYRSAREAFKALSLKGGMRAQSLSYLLKLGVHSFCLDAPFIEEILSSIQLTFATPKAAQSVSDEVVDAMLSMLEQLILIKEDGALAILLDILTGDDFVNFPHPLKEKLRRIQSPAAIAAEAKF